ncbi:acyl-CoA thioesterase [Nodosilinea sp. LEGE 07088]|uniref:acyl-CoA thioesterase n=1 Tax=Nodosilinea sp. LEGE 07088 TaxID=2777968 RepID=UPI001882E7F2|nr:thioesterase family protein [Nodosilinea sp. LEGE 07088]MBE9140066.1 acyl-CoA thioesterase [Nodosilinea sp. LEGE 07088]
MKMFYHYEFVVPTEVVDGNGHVNNVAYVQWMQDIAIAHATSAGCTAETQALGATWVARSHQITYLRPAFTGDRLCLTTWITTLRKARSTRQYKFLRLSDDSVLATGETDWVFVDAVTHRPRTIPASVSDCFELVTTAEKG